MNGSPPPRATKPSSISLVLAPAPVGGLEAVVLRLAEGLAARGNRVTVAVLLDRTGEWLPLDSLSSGAIDVVRVRAPHRGYRQEIRELSAALASNPGTIVHTHGYHADLVGWRAARLCGSCIVSTVHGFTGGGWRNRCYEKLDRVVLRRFDGVIAVSRRLGEELVASGVPRPRVHCIPNAHSTPTPLPGREASRSRLGLPAADLVAGWVGRLSHEKGPDFFIEALARCPDWRGAVLGDGPMAATLREQAASLGVAQRLSWHGMVPGAGNLLQAFDALVLSSRTEGTPIVLLEGMAAMVPLVVTSVGGIPDMVTEREALVLPPGRPNLLAGALEEIRSNPHGALARAQAARERLVSAYAIEPWLDRHEALYRSLLDATPGQATPA